MFILQIHSCSSLEQKLAHSYSLSCHVKLHIYHERTTRRLLNYVLWFEVSHYQATWLKNNQYHFRLPGAYHLAKGVARVIHTLHQGFMIRNECKLIAIERRDLSEFCIFAAPIYSPVASDAPVSDLMLIRAMKEYTNMRISATPLGTEYGVLEPVPRQETHLKSE